MRSSFAVIGNLVNHSLSPIIHRQFAQQFGLSLRYEKIQVNSTQFETEVINFFQKGGDGLNVTLPFKERAFAMSAKVRHHGQVAKSVNTLWMKDGLLYADNTDGVGFLRDIQRYKTLTDQRILLLGAGGAARGILGPLLLKKPLQLTVANRTMDKLYPLQQDFPVIDICTLSELVDPSYEIIINATSASLEDQRPLLSSSLLLKQPFCYDLAYKKSSETAFVNWSRSLGCQARDGLGMLVEQAAESFYIWHGWMPKTAPVLQYL